ncbi:MAG TPA: type II secretion system F family protein [Longimicrobiales bacterium]|nr:type II secretion system F family protein [Longimicrobiales bacterium]
MPYLVALFAGLSATLVMAGLIQIWLAPERVVSKEVASLRDTGPKPFEAGQRRRRREQRQRLQKVLRDIGQRIEEGQPELEGMRRRLVQAGYWDPEAVRYYLGARVLLAAVLGGGTLLIGGALGGRIAALLFFSSWLAGLGWIAPQWYVSRRRTMRWREVQLALPDTLDLLVACVEAGMGLNQALARVADEVRHMSPVMSTELAMVNLEIRAGTPRSEALTNLGRRSELEDVRSLVNMLAQADRFGTSIAQSLRVHVDALRTKRRQAAEEAAAKTTIKLVFPLVLFIFPALFVVILTPAVIQVVEQLLSL